MKYTKPPLTFQEQVELLKSRGLIITDDAKTITILQNINYYRLSAYFPPFQTEKDVFDKGTTLDAILCLYEYDRRLQNLILEASANIEISVRTQLAYYLAHNYGTFGYLDSGNFYHFFDHYHWLRRIRESINRSHEVFVKHFRAKYTSETDLPVWMVCEVISFGQVSQLLRGLKKTDRQAIAKSHFDIDHMLMTSWLHTIVYVRNLCAHHSRIWNRILAIQPMRNKKDRDWNGIRNDKIFAVFLIIKKLTRFVGKWDEWGGKLLTLLGEFPNVDVTRMGFPDNWREVIFERHKV